MTNNLKYFYFKEEVIKLVRNFFDKRNFHEVITPVLNQTIPLQEHITPFVTQWEYLDNTRLLYLTTSPEAYLKYLLGEGVDKCYAIGHSFRNKEDANSDHNPEFLMLEWYRTGASMQDIMTDVRKLIEFILNNSQYINEKIKSITEKKWPKISLEVLSQQYLNTSIGDLEDIDNLNSIAKKNNIPTNDNWHELFDHIFLNIIEPQLLVDRPFFLIDFPSKASPFCTCKQDKPYLAHRFELYFNGHEVANGNSESTDYSYISKLFDQLSKASNYPISIRFINSLKKMQGKKYAGIGLGLERLIMIIGKIDSLQKITSSSLI